MTRSVRDLWKFPRLNRICSLEATRYENCCSRVKYPSGHSVEVETEDRKQSIAIAPKTVGRGSSINGGELLFVAMATCFCKDLYREAAKRGIDVQDVRVEVTGTFGNPGEPAHDISYRVQVHADTTKAMIDDLIRSDRFRH